MSQSAFLVWSLVIGGIATAIEIAIVVMAWDFKKFLRQLLLKNEERILKGWEKRSQVILQSHSLSQWALTQHPGGYSGVPSTAMPQAGQVPTSSSPFLYQYPGKKGGEKNDA